MKKKRERKTGMRDMIIFYKSERKEEREEILTLISLDREGSLRGGGERGGKKRPRSRICSLSQGAVPQSATLR